MPCKSRESKGNFLSPRFGFEPPQGGDKLLVSLRDVTPPYVLTSTIREVGWALAAVLQATDSAGSGVDA